MKTISQKLYKRTFDNSDRSIINSNDDKSFKYVIVYIMEKEDGTQEEQYRTFKTKKLAQEIFDYVEEQLKRGDDKNEN